MNFIIAEREEDEYLFRIETCENHEEFFKWAMKAGRLTVMEKSRFDLQFKFFDIPPEVYCTPYDFAVCIEDDLDM